MTMSLESLALEVAARLVGEDQAQLARDEVRRIVRNETSNSQLAEGTILGYVALIVQISSIVIEVWKIYGNRSRTQQVSEVLNRIVAESDDATLADDPKIKQAAEVAVEIVNSK